MIFKRIFLLAGALVAVATLSGCANDFQARVSRFHQALPPPEQGASFTVQPDDPALAGSLEFAHYADQVAGRLAALGYMRAADPAEAKLVVRFSYEVDKGRERIVSSRVRRNLVAPVVYPVAHRVPTGDGGSAVVVRYVIGYREPYLWGYDDFYDRDVDSYTVFQSQLTLKIDRVDGGRVFEGTALAQSLSNRLTYLVPNLVDALFSGFPGKDGEEIRVTVAPEPKAKN